MRTRIGMLCFAAWVLTTRTSAEPTPTNQVGETDDPMARYAVRDPFWPVGFSPTVKKAEEKKQEVEKQVKAEIVWPSITVKGYTQAGAETLAILDGGTMVRAGETIKRTSNGLVYRWKVSAITARGVSIRKLDVTPVGSNEKPIAVYSKE